MFKDMPLGLSNSWPRFAHFFIKLPQCTFYARLKYQTKNSCSDLILVNLFLQLYKIEFLQTSFLAWRTMGTFLTIKKVGSKATRIKIVFCVKVACLINVSRFWAVNSKVRNRCDINSKPDFNKTNQCAFKAYWSNYFWR